MVVVVEGSHFGVVVRRRVGRLPDCLDRQVERRVAFRNGRRCLQSGRLHPSIDVISNVHRFAGVTGAVVGYDDALVVDWNDGVAGAGSGR